MGAELPIGHVATVVVTVLVGLAVLIVTAPVLRSLPEPTPDGPDGADAATKTPYHRLAVPSFVLACIALAVAAALTATTLVPLRALPFWLVLATAGVLLASIDAVTTWLPLRLTRWAWVLTVPAAIAALLLGADWSDLGRAAAGAAIAGAAYGALWFVTRGGIQFGDVRFAPLIGAAAGAYAWDMLLWSLALGTLVGGLHGLVRLVRRQPGGFAYAPSMLLGPFLALVLALAL